jgi:hypothetical protein
VRSALPSDKITRYNELIATNANARGMLSEKSLTKFAELIGLAMILILVALGTLALAKNFLFPNLFGV